jgi:hypothetical protein
VLINFFETCVLEEFLKARMEKTGGDQRWGWLDKKLLDKVTRAN